MIVEPHVDIPDETLSAWQEIVDIMADIIGVPAGLVMRLGDADIEVLIASQTPKNPYKPGDKEHFQGSGLYCETVVRRNARLIVPNALSDAEWRTNPDVKIGMISYLGFPLLYPDGKPFGTICVLDDKENAYSDKYERLVEKFRNLVQSDLEIIHMNRILGDENRRLVDYLMELQALRGMVPICMNCKSIRDEHDTWHPIEHYLVRHPEATFSHSICPRCRDALYPKRTR
jgi:transcriptional regulator with GAF, ATPase, and Fis domain